MTRLSPERTRLIIVMTALVLVCAVSMGKSLRAALSSEKTPDRELTHALTRMRGSLPPSGIVGYIDGRSHDDPVGMQNYYLTQYDLAPLVVTRSEDEGATSVVVRSQGNVSNPDWVVGNFFLQGGPPAKPGDLIAVRDFGSGVILFSKKNSLIAKRER